MTASPLLPPGVAVFERGWLSSNNILFVDADRAALVDSGYATHAEQTLALVDHALAGRPLDLLVNTHLHSDHCGGNAALQGRHPALRTLIPPGQAEAVRAWDETALSYRATGQQCPRFTIDDVLAPGRGLRLAGREWQAHAAPGHDPDSLILFEPASRTLISADALWAQGFGVVFPELDGVRAFEAVGDTLDLIEQLDPVVVIPGHGAPFTQVAQALAAARRRLDGFMNDPGRHSVHAAKVLLKFKLLEFQSLALPAFIEWAATVPFLTRLHAQSAPGAAFGHWVTQLADDLVVAGAASREGDLLRNR